MNFLHEQLAVCLKLRHAKFQRWNCVTIVVKYAVSPLRNRFLFVIERHTLGFDIGSTVGFP